MIKLVNKLNEWKPPLTAAGGQKEERTETDTKPPQTSPIHTSANQETRSGKKTVRKVGTDEWKLGEERSRSEDLQRIWTVWDELEFSNLATGGKDHILKHMYTQTEILELTGSDHNLLPPRPPTQGRTSQRLRRVGQFRPRTTTRTPVPSSSESFLFLSTSFLLCCFSLSSSVAFCSLLS